MLFRMGEGLFVCQPGRLTDIDPGGCAKLTQNCMADTFDLLPDPG
jgi:hypothetical protein